MKRREIDFFAVILGLVIGGVFGYFIGTRMNLEQPKEVMDDTPIYGNVYLLQILRSDNLDNIQSVLDDVDITYEIVNDNGMYYVYSAIATEDAVLEAKKSEFISLGFSPIIKSQYILDWPDKFSKEQDKYAFYNDAVKYLLDSVSGESIVIADRYYSDPVDLQVFSNLTLIKSIKNQNIKLELQLETYRLLFERCN